MVDDGCASGHAQDGRPATGNTVVVGSPGSQRVYCTTRGALQVRADSVGAWRSLVARSVRDAEAGGSNPLAPTIHTYCIRNYPDVGEQRLRAEGIGPAVCIRLRGRVDRDGLDPQDLHLLEECLGQQTST